MAGNRTVVLAGVGALLLAIVAGLLAGGEAGSFLLAGLEAGPFLVLAVLAQVGQKRRWARFLTYLWLYMMVGGAVLFVLLVAWMAVAQEADPLGATSLAPLGGVGLGLLAGLALATPLLFRGVRASLGRRLPIDPDSLLHKTALFFVAFFVVASLTQLAALGGRPPLLTTVAASPTVDVSGGRSETGQVLDLFYSLIWTLPMAAVAAGYPLRRAFRPTLSRLGFVRPTRRQVLLGIALAAALVLLFDGVDRGIAWVWGLFGWPTTNTAAFEKLLGAGFSLFGAVAVGVTAGIGEEVTTRGLLQPRFGMVLPNLAFTSAHAFQYGPDALLSVFLLGMILALVRARSSTTIAALVHGSYDFLVILVGVLSP